MKDEPLVFLNDQVMPASQAHISIFDAGIVLGATVAEQTRTFDKRLWRLDEHLDRLLSSLRCTRIDIGLSKDQLACISQELIEHNTRLLDESGELGLIQFVTAGENPIYAGISERPPRTSPTVCVHTYPLPFALWAKKMLTGAHVITPSIRHVPPQCYDPKVKYRSRMHFYLADLEARQVDPEATALLLDLAGNITETSTANFLIVERGTIISPTTVNILPGISRTMVIELAGKLGIPFLERDLQVDDAISADEAFLTSTTFCLMPVTKINGAQIGEGRPGALTRLLLHTWSAKVGVDIEKQITSRKR
ncbi:MAG TPA: aminotransferase class IV [Gemmataceae bacterium]|jgi:branched-subunit amino acid aminotransferase/4-amino-4-deoxychorismate lyase